MKYVIRKMVLLATNIPLTLCDYIYFSSPFYYKIQNTKVENSFKKPLNFFCFTKYI